MARGRPPKYSNPDDLQKQIDLYFVPKNEPFTVQALSLFLGFATYFSLYDYRDKRGKEFSHIIKTALSRCEAYVAQLLLKDNNAAGKIFYLKNTHQWKDQQDHNHTGGVTIVLQSSIPEPKSVEES